MDNQVSTTDDEAKMRLMRETFFKGCTNEEIQLFLYIAKKSGLDPLLKQIYPIKRWDTALRREVMTAQTGIEGYRLIAERTGCYAPGKETVFDYDKDGNLLSATAYVKKLSKDGTWHDVSGIAFYDEYVQRKKDGQPTSFWVKMKRGQTAKCAEALAIKKAFPGEMSQVVSDTEMMQSTTGTDEVAIVDSIAVSVENSAIVEQTVFVINDIQAEDLRQMIGDDVDLLNEIIGFLIKHFQIDALEEITLELYPRVKQYISNRKSANENK